MSLLELCIAVGILSSMLFFSSYPFRRSLYTLHDTLNLHSGIHFLDGTRARARATYSPFNFSPEELREMSPLSSIESSNTNGVGFTKTGSSNTPTTLRFSSGKSISIPITTVGKFTVKQ